MANAPREQAVMTIAPRHTKHKDFNGSETAWRALCDQYPTAETPEILMAVLDYCAVRKLDPYKKPVHVVPMWNPRLKRQVQVVMQGINEIQITASRSGKWAGMDETVWGPTVERTFRGTKQDRHGNDYNTQVTLRYPEWASVIVYKLMDGKERPFPKKCFWEEYYARAGLNTEVPNARWTQAPRQMIEKCCLAGALRSAFPEEDLGYAAEEMEDQPMIEGTYEEHPLQQAQGEPEIEPEPESDDQKDSSQRQSDDQTAEPQEPKRQYVIVLGSGIYTYDDVDQWAIRWDDVLGELKGKPDVVRRLHDINKEALAEIAKFDAPSAAVTIKKIETITATEKPKK